LKEIKIQHNNNSFKNVGSEISRLENLEKINFGNNWKLNGKQVIISLSKLHKLKDLDFFGCRLDTIPIEIADFPALELLNLTRNPAINFADLFKKLSSVKTLKHLDISDNELAVLPREIGLLTSLERLVIGQNSISTLPDEFFNMANLKVLNVYGNYNSRISKEGLQEIKKRLPNCKIISDWVFRD
jgi:leucine-rich repeat protein SHOC2